MILSRQTMRDWRDHARRCYPLESCGLIVGGAYLPAPNAHDDPGSGFKIDPAFLATTPDIEMILHTHTKAAHPSRSDMEGQAFTDIPWGIGYCPNGTMEDWFFWGDSLPIRPLKGRNFRWGVTDCYTVVRDWFRLHGSVTLPVFPRERDDFVRGNALFDQFGEAGFHEIESAEYPGDVMVFQIDAPVPNHCGVLISQERFIHQPMTGVSRSSMVQLWSRKAVGIFRHEVLVR